MWQNDHHWQYWILPEGRWREGKGALHMMVAYVEMICDWTAMSYKFGGTALEYYEINKDAIKIKPDHLDFVERVLLQMDA